MKNNIITRDQLFNISKIFFQTKKINKTRIENSKAMSLRIGDWIVRDEGFEGEENFHLRGRVIQRKSFQQSDRAGDDAMFYFRRNQLGFFTHEREKKRWKKRTSESGWVGKC
jgi:hypothetical protein